MTTVYKKDSQNDETSDWAVSILSNLSKVYEKCILMKWQNTSVIFYQHTSAISVMTVIHNITSNNRKMKKY